MTKKIEAIFLDTGNTMRVVAKDAAFQNNAQQKLVELLGVNEVPAEFCKRLAERYLQYKNWSKESLTELSEEKIWTRWMLPDDSPAKIKPLAERLTRLWIDQNGRRMPRPDVKTTLTELERNGYTLGIIANSISRSEIPEWLEKDDLAKFFKCVLLSSKFGQRKPAASVFLEAARMVAIEPGKCAYVGDNPSRDIEGARKAGFGMVVILLENATLAKEAPKGRERPDAIIRECKDLLTIFHPRAGM
jgi:putative hydrolase of the HAD superfamily